MHVSSPCPGDTLQARLAFLDRADTLFPEDLYPRDDEDIEMFERQDPFALLTAALMPEAYGDTRFYEETYGPIPDGAELTRRLDAALILEATGVVPTAGRVVTMSQTLVSMGYTTTQPVIHRPF